MKNNILTGLLAASVLSLFQSCDFDAKVTDRLQDEVVWKSEKLVLSAMTNLYDKLELEQLGSYYEPAFGISNLCPTTFSDEGVGAYQAGDFGVSDVARANYGNEWLDIWKDTYDKIRSCNIFMAKLQDAAIEESLKAAYMAEARFIRAFHYFNLVKRYGGVPLITDVQEYGDIDDLAKLQLPRNKEQEVWDFIIKEIDEIAPELPETRDAANRTRVTSYAAYALQSRAALYAASIAKYGEVQLGGIVGVDASLADGYYKKSAEASDMIINSGKYTLYSKYTDKTENFRNMFLEKRGNSEYIFWKEFSAPLKGHSFDLFFVPISFTQNGYGCGITPGIDMVEAFEYTDGTPGTLKLTDAAGNYIEYDSPLDLFAGKDPRLRATFYLPYDDCRGGIVEIRRGIYDESLAGNDRFITSGTTEATYGSGDKTMKILGKDGVWDTGDVGKTGFYCKKFADEGVTDISGGKSETAWPVFRLGEIYLNKAEAAMELGQAAQATEALNMIRNRAGIKPLAQGEVTIERIRNERRVELAYESHRWWDMKRWRIAGTILADYPTTALYPWYVWQDGKYIFTTGKAPKPNKVFQEKNYYTKIKDDDMKSNPKLAPNNPGF